MEVKIFTKEMSAQEVKKVKEYSMTKVPAIESLLQHFAPDAANLRINAEKLGRRSAYKVEFVLHLPSKIIIGEEASHEITKAVDLAKDRIVRQLKKHEELLRSKHGKKHKLNIKEIDFDKIPAFAELKPKNKDIFADILQPHLVKLNKFIKREIFHNESLDIIPQDVVESESILNDVILDFYANYNPQMKGKALEQWLYTVAISKIRTAIDEYKEEDMKEIPIEEEAVPRTSEIEDYFEEKEIENVVNEVPMESDDETPENISSKKELFRFLMAELSKVDAKKREAFILNKMEGFVAAQISEMQHRPLKSVTMDIEFVQKVLAEKAKAEFGEEV
ncbi:MAG: RNA polymerase sigma factor, sigma-70 family [Candidatus Peregrinibacteria bacterium GW2011_GWF2_38_29]|nr:MAG: RNA polymerase sigma factor, sigma-70 family [Candidatus Peregrinibacteria bacterium GW2011_GWF2_38_29]HBB02597.1 hypothetical protein [Candidatus Peregrinibacteria bacterium]